MRNTICVSNLDPDLHEWLKEQAEKLSDNGKRITMSDLFNEAVTLLKAQYDVKKEKQEAEAANVN